METKYNLPALFACHINVEGDNKI